MGLSSARPPAQISMHGLEEHESAVLGPVADSEGVHQPESAHPRELRLGPKLNSGFVSIDMHVQLMQAGRGVGMYQR